MAVAERREETQEREPSSLPASKAVGEPSPDTAAPSNQALRRLMSGQFPQHGGANPLPLLDASAGNAAIQRLVAGSGRALPDGVREHFEPRLATELSGVRVHTGPEAAASAHALQAEAYTVGDDIVFGDGRYAPHTAAGREVLAHELTHVAQNRRGATGTGISSPTDPAEVEAARTARLISDPAAPAAAAEMGAAPDAGVHRQHEGGGDTPPPDAGKPPPDIPVIPPSWVVEPGPADVLVGVSGGQMVALPAAGSVVLLRPPKAAANATPAAPGGPLLTVPTVGKESVKMVNVGERVGFLLDIGGRPEVVFPAAYAAMTRALGVDRAPGGAITHIHEDHNRSLVEMVVTSRITPDKLIFPEGFAMNPNAPSSTFAGLQRALAADPRAQALGHSAGAAYGVIRTPAEGNWFRFEVVEGNVSFEFYGLSAAFRELEARRARGEAQANAQVAGQSVPSLADTASLLTRVTHRPTGFRILVLSDLRFADLRMFKTAMGEAAYGELFQGVRVVEGAGHHLGALESSADRAGFAEFLKDAQLRNGRLIIVAQSQERLSGRQFLNRSMIAALNAAGIDVHVSLEPQGGQVGTLTVNTDGTVNYSGGGRVHQTQGDPAVNAQIERLSRLRTAEEILARYERFAEPQYRRAGELRAAREALENVLGDLMTTTAGNVQRGAAGRANEAVRDPAAQAQALTRAQQTTNEVELLLVPGFMAGLRELQQLGPVYETFERAARVARETGRMPPEGIEALWELHPETARRLLGTSGLSRRAQRQALAQLPGQPAPVGVRSVAVVLLAVEAANLAAPIVQSIRASRYNDNVRPALEDILWWQDKGVFPDMEAVDDNVWPFSNEWTTDPKRVNQLLEDKEVSYLALTGIADRNWDRFTVWASAKLMNYRDWAAHVHTTKAIRSSGQVLEEQTWEYRTQTLSGTWSGHDQTEVWQKSDRLTLIMRAAARDVVENTEEQIGEREKMGDEGPSVSRPDASRPVYAGLPQTTGRMRFKKDVEPALYTLYKQEKRTGYRAESVFVTFPPGTGGYDAPDGYVLVGGGDVNTYIQVLGTPNLVSYQVEGKYGTDTLGYRPSPNLKELLFAKTSDLEAAQ